MHACDVEGKASASEGCGGSPPAGVDATSRRHRAGRTCMTAVRFQSDRRRDY
jgi:hypothetical protein